MPGGAGVPRIAGVAEAAAVARLLDAFNREFDVPTPGVPVLEARLRRLLAPPGNLVALLAGDPAHGVAVVALRPSVWRGGPVGLLEELFVLPELRNRGVGAALLHAAEAAVRARGGSALEIEVSSGDAGARRFYERHGYTDHDPGGTDQALAYSRDLDRPD